MEFDLPDQLPIVGRSRGRQYCILRSIRAWWQARAVVWMVAHCSRKLLLVGSFGTATIYALVLLGRARAEYFCCVCPRLSSSGTSGAAVATYVVTIPVSVSRRSVELEQPIPLSTHAVGIVSTATQVVGYDSRRRMHRCAYDATGEKQWHDLANKRYEVVGHNGIILRDTESAPPAPATSGAPTRPVNTNSISNTPPLLLLPTSPGTPSGR